jgi:hypothetical protein
MGETPGLQQRTKLNVRLGYLLERTTAKEYRPMKRILVPSLLLLAASVGYAKDQPAYQRGVLLQMDSASCGYAEKGSHTLGAELLGTDGQHTKTQELLCQEYTLQTDRLVFRIRPKADKHASLLPVGESAQFRLHKDKLLLRLTEGDGKEREYIVVSMTPRADAPNPVNQSASRFAPLM